MLEKFLIVGFDPGNTVGVSIIDFEGNVVNVFSYRNVSLSQVIVDILEFGFPIVVSTDKKSVPKNVKFLSSKLNLKVVTPKFDLKYDFKKKLVNNFLKYKKSSNNVFRNVSFSNSHEFDSFSAAVFAFNKFKNIIFKIKKHIVDVREEDFFSFILEVFSGKNVVNVKNSFLELYSFESSFEENFEDSFKKENFDFDNSNNINKIVFKDESFNVKEEFYKKKIDFLFRQNFFLKRKVYFNNKKLFYFKSLVSILSEDVKKNLKFENKIFNKLFLLESKVKKFEFEKNFLFENTNFFDGLLFDNKVFLKQNIESFVFDSKVKLESLNFELFKLKEKSNIIKKEDNVDKTEFESIIEDYKLFRKKYYKK